MSNESRPDNSGLSFMLRWGFLTATGRIVAIILGALLAAPLTLTIEASIGQLRSSYAPTIINNGFRGLLIGLMIGVVQWLLLRNRLQSALGWFFALMVGETLGLAFIASFIKFCIDTFLIHPGILVPVVVSPIIGFLIALAQGNILHKNSYPGKQWFLTVPIVWAITQYFYPAVQFSFASSPYLRPDARTSLLVTGVVFLLIGAVLQGAIEGIVLARIFRYGNQHLKQDHS